jgi:NTP pyrophosphatase (non-canonical NTP hydrolase)
MTELNEVMLQTRLTAKFPKDNALSYCMIALAGEVGELANQYKKELRGDFTDAQKKADNRMKMIDELGDVLWYVAALADALGVDLETVFVMNRDKLTIRHATSLASSTSSYDQPQ